jgi:hypothetical protein
MVCAMLEDAKLEVREMAATTLSGKPAVYFIQNGAGCHRA